MSYKNHGERRKELRRRYGQKCIKCIADRPRASPAVLLPQQRCPVDGHLDDRPHLTEAQRNLTAGDFKYPIIEEKIG